MKKATVVIGKKAYEMTEEAAKKMLQAASEQVPLGIYAIQRGSYYELRTDRLTKTQTKEQRRKWKREGWKVHCNL